MQKMSCFRTGHELLSATPIQVFCEPLIFLLMHCQSQWSGFAVMPSFRHWSLSVISSHFFFEFNSRTYKLIHTPTVVQGGEGGWSPTLGFLLHYNILKFLPLMDSL